MNAHTADITGSKLHTLYPLNSEYYGRYRGTVVENDDPEHRGRCKVFVYGVYNEAFANDRGANLPWAEPAQPLFCGGIDKNGVFQCPDMNSTVWIEFESGDTTRPIMVGQTTDKNGYFDIDHCRMYWDGMYIEYEKSTHTVTVSATNLIAIASNDATVEVWHDAKVSVGNDATVDVGNDLVTTVGNDATITAGNDINMYAGSNVNITAPKLNIIAETTITGGLTVSNDAVIGGKAYLPHMHIGNHGAPTSPPI